ncbi:MAG: hypothetical protein ACMUIA_01345 [bacterium]
MKAYIKLLSVTALFIFILPYFSHAEHWEKVVDRGFENPRNDYAWSMETFKGKLYVGTLNLWGGGEIWCSESGEEGTWEKIYESRLGQNYGIRCLYADGDKALYACTSSVFGAKIMRSTDGQTWETLLKKGWGHRRNTTIRCMIRFGDYLYAGAGGNSAELYRSSDGIVWELVNTEPRIASTMVSSPLAGRFFQNRKVINNVMIGELAVFNGHLYAFTWTKDLDMRSALWVMNRSIVDPGASFLPSSSGAFEVWRSENGVNWEKVVGQDDEYGNGMGFSGPEHGNDPHNMDNDVVTSVAVFRGEGGEYLYLGTEHDYGRTSVWRTKDGTEWKKVLDFYEEGEKYNYYVWRMIPFQGKLYVGTWNMGSTRNPGVTGAQIWVSDNGETFDPIVHNGFDGEYITFTPMVGISKSGGVPKNYGIRSFGILNKTLFAGTATVLAVPARRSGRSGSIILGRDVGCEIWKMCP